MIIRRGLLALLLIGLAGPASALHIDVVVGASGGKLTTSFCANGAQGCDALPVLQQLGLPAGTLAHEWTTGKAIYVTDFGDFDGGPFAVDDPGFFSGAGSLPANLLLRYQGLGSLRYWNPTLEQWQSQTPNDERIRLFGGLDLQTVVSTDRSHCGGLLICIPRTVTSTVATEGSTLFTDSGVQGAPSLIVDNTAANGSLHAHLDWFLELPGGQRSGAAGAYLLELRLTADGFTASDPFLVLFNRGLDDGSFGRALGALVLAPHVPEPNPVPLPSAAWMMLGGLGLMASRWRKSGAEGKARFSPRRAGSARSREPA